MKTAVLTTVLTLTGLLTLAPAGRAQPQPTKAALPEPGELGVELQPSGAEVGDLIVATLTITAPPQAIGPPVFPDWGETWGEAELRDVGPVENTSGSNYQQKVTLAVFRTGAVVLPPLTVEIPTAEEVILVPSQPRSLEIRSVLPPDVENPEARPAAPPHALPIGRSFWRTTLALAVACLIAAVFLARHRSQERRAEAVAVPPLEALTHGLKSLRKVEDGEALHTGLSLHLRRFLGRSFGFPALESTTTEVRHRLANAETPRALVSRTEKILRLCDLIKFARGGPAPLAPEPPGIARGRLDEALALGRELDLHLHPPEPAAAEQSAEQAA